MNGNFTRRLAGLVMVTTLLAGFEARADVGLIVSAANLRDECGGLAPTGSVALLVVDTGGNGFSPFVFSGSPLTPGSYLGGDDLIIARWDLSSLNQPGQLLNATSKTLDALVNTGDLLALYWFPTLTAASTTTGDGRFGFYTNSVGLDGSAPWVVPFDGFVVQMNCYTASRAGSNPNGTGFASHGFLEPAQVCGAGSVTLSLDDTNVVVYFTSVPNGHYDIQTTTDLVSGAWNSITNNLAGTGDIMTNIDLGGSTTLQRFYRVGLHF